MILSSLHTQLFHSRNDRLLKKYRTEVSRIHQHEARFKRFSDSEIAEQSQSWRQTFAAIEDDHELRKALQKRALEVFALALQASRRLCGRELSLEGAARTWDMVYHDVQLIGGLAMHDSAIAEMATGEGKTLAATLPAYLAALSGRGVHIVTVNDYLAKRDAEWMGHLYSLLGVSVGCLQSEFSPEERRQVYQKDIIYGTASELGFDYLRDHCTAVDSSQVVQRPPFFALIDEIDSILIDEARTPLIISGTASHDRSAAYQRMCPAVSRLVQAQQRECHALIKEAKIQLGSGDEREAAELLFQVQLAMPKHPGLRKVLEDPAILRLVEQTGMSMRMVHRSDELASMKETLLFSQDHQRRTVDLSERGCRLLSPNDSKAFTMPDEESPQAIEQAANIHAVNQLLRAFTLYERDRDYHIVDNNIEIIDAEKGRALGGRRWSEGLHQAVQTKEGVPIEPETSTYATITLQNYFRLYPKLAGMTGTALPEEEEFGQVFGLKVASIPPNKTCQREDHPDRVYRTQSEKLAAVVREIKEAHARQQPVLVGTAHVDISERLSRMLRRQGVPHRVLNAKRPSEEAEIVARAGQLGAVTVSTNMAGRGTDIRLGEGAAERGGLYVIGTERHQSSRVGLQLRGRSGRQGDPGSSRFFVSLEDELFKRFGISDRLTRWLERFGQDEGEALEHSLITRSLDRAQRQLEEHHSKQRRLTLKYDDVLHSHRSAIYDWREAILESAEPRQLIEEWFEPEKTLLKEHAQRWQDVEGVEVCDVERQVLLSVLDEGWRDHLEWLEELREDVHFETVAQRDPLLEYRRRAFERMPRFEAAFGERVLSTLASIRPRVTPDVSIITQEPRKSVSRNAPCPCGSGKKYKRCCLLV